MIMDLRDFVLTNGNLLRFQLLTSQFYPKRFAWWQSNSMNEIREELPLKIGILRSIPNKPQCGTMVTVLVDFMSYIYLLWFPFFNDLGQISKNRLFGVAGRASMFG